MSFRIMASSFSYALFFFFLSFFYFQLGTLTTLQEFQPTQLSMVTWPWQMDTTTQRKTWRTVRRLCNWHKMLTLSFSLPFQCELEAFSCFISPFHSPQTPVGGQKQPLGLWWSASVASASQFSARPALCATSHGRSWWCRASTPTGHTRRVWASSCSVMQNQTPRKCILLKSGLCQASYHTSARLIQLQRSTYLYCTIHGKWSLGVW